MPSINIRPSAERPAGFRYSLGRDYIELGAEMPDRPEWSFVAEYRSSNGAGWVLGRLEVLPTARTERPPRGGISSKLLRSIPLSKLPDWISLIDPTRDLGVEVHGGLRGDNFVTAFTGAYMTDFRARPRPGRFGRDDLPYAELARNYLDAAARSRRPIKDLAEMWGFSESTIRDALAEARRSHRGLLESAGRGRRGGHLTPKAKQLLGIEE